MNTATQSLPCPLWRRLLALVYDLLAVIAIAACTGLFCQLLTGGQLFDAHGKPLTWWFQPVEYLTISAYFIASWLRGGQTLGMRPWRIRVTANDGGKPSLRQALIRLIVAALPILLLELHPWLGLRGALWAVLMAWGLWFAFGLVDRRRRALHDVAAGTEIRLI
ncbi:RDD family protein [Dyella tabacisoli]|uniref:RDD family protein n=1 Tax=Dyella tabacisoli TaxID=2282381 RepID=A0A369UQZ0_9GAMM|nr:RDD family protein [Dyella tabacisoli]RDD82887.1 RDD family protein [Dyella tabacisoli]